MLTLGASITACRSTGRHIEALEENQDIFDALLKPMQKPTLGMEKGPPKPPIVQASQDLDEMPIVPRKFPRKGTFSK